MALSDSAGIGSALPSQVGVTSGYVLQTDGAAASWVSASASSLPSQGGNSGKFLTTNGTAASWAAVTATSLLPDQTGNNGKVLGTNGTALSWVDASGLTLAAFGSTPDAKGASFSAGTLTMEPADFTHPGSISTGTQLFAGSKSFEHIKLDPTGAATVLEFTATGGTYGLWMYPNVDGTVTGSNFSLASLNDGNLYLRCEGTGGGGVALMVGAAIVGVAKLATLDLTGMGNSGSIKLKDDLGATKTATISGGAWVIT